MCSERGASVPRPSSRYGAMRRPMPMRCSMTEARALRRSSHANTAARTVRKMVRRVILAPIRAGPSELEEGLGEVPQRGDDVLVGVVAVGDPLVAGDERLRAGGAVPVGAVGVASGLGAHGAVDEERRGARELGGDVDLVAVTVDEPAAGAAGPALPRSGAGAEAGAVVGVGLGPGLGVGVAHRLQAARVALAEIIDAEPE